MSWDQDAFKHTLDFAAKVHGDQRVPGSGAPYVVHLIKVASEVLRTHHADPTFDVDFACTCALLHDSIEDAGVDPDTLAELFGSRVAAGVAALSKNPHIEKSLRMEDALRRIKDQPREVGIVKLCDRITNLEPPPSDWSRDKCLAYQAEARRIHQALKECSVVAAQRLSTKIEAYAVPAV